MVTAIVTLLIFLVLISIHEFGHFITAKALGVFVHEFSIGMGPAIYKRQGKETLYSVRLLPIGGYCKLEGEDGGSDSPKAFSNQKLWKRFIIVSAGAILNLLLGVVLFCFVVKLMSPVSTNVIGSVDERSYLADTGVTAGDKILAVNGNRIFSYNDISLYTGEFDENTTEFEITVKRDGKKENIRLKPSHNEIKVEYHEDYAELTDTTNGISNTERIEYNGKEIPGSYIGKTFTEDRYIIGITPKKEDITIANVIPQAFGYTVFVGKSVFIALKGLLTGKMGLETISGPVGVAEVVNQAVNSGKDSLLNILFIMAMLTVNLGIFNLLPIPALDGGRLFFMVVELIGRKPIPPEKEGLVHAIGLVLMMIFAAVVCCSDIIKLIK